MFQLALPFLSIPPHQAPALQWVSPASALPESQHSPASEPPAPTRGSSVTPSGLLTSVAALVHHEHIGPDADHAADITLQLAVG